jgi:hypothetical protein
MTQSLVGLISGLGATAGLVLAIWYWEHRQTNKAAAYRFLQ